MLATPLKNLSHVSLGWRIARLPERDQRTVIARMKKEGLDYHLRRWRTWGRDDQLAPESNWAIWVMQAGRGSGKTRAGAEWVLEQVRTGTVGRIHLVGRTLADVRDVMVEGPSGILTCARDDERPTYQPSLRKLTWPNGAEAITFGSQRAAALRGPQADCAWCDELASWHDAPLGSQQDSTWSNLLLGLRRGRRPRCVVTTTPKPVRLYRDLLGLRGVVVTDARTEHNLAFLAPGFQESVIALYADTRLGRQEVGGELIDDVPGALWRQDLIEPYRVPAERCPRDFAQVVVALDPAVTTGPDSAETGIIVAARGQEGDWYVLRDASGQYSPLGWARTALTLYQEYQADAIVGEVNHGGDLVEANLRSVSPYAPFRPVTASRGKATRAQPIASLYEQGRVHHVGVFPQLEDQLTCWVPDAGMPSPDRLDALVWALTELQPEDRGFSGWVIGSLGGR